MKDFSYISNAEVGYIDDLYQQYAENPSNVDVSWQRFFEGFDFSRERFGEPGEGGEVDATTLAKEVAVRKLIDAYRLRGHLESKTNPVRPRRDRKARLALSDFGLSDEDLNTEFDAGKEIGLGRTTLRNIVVRLKAIYVGAIGFEFMAIREPETWEWLRQKIEDEYPKFNPPLEQKKRILGKLNQAVTFENFLHKKYVGQKRFSLEGGESTIPALDAIINKGAELGVSEFIIGMAHRGRLNVLANTLGKTYDAIFEEFEGSAIPDETLGDGDVKYHMGFSSQTQAANGQTVAVRLAPNPSHLEAVNPVVQGFARAKTDYDKRQQGEVLPILIHGDAAVAGQGIMYEIIQMSGLEGYNVGGTIHFVINNQVGFTTDFDDARTSTYSSDISQVIESPEIHVNGDDPEAVVFAVQLAVEFRQKFKRDIFVDMVCYRKHGHNESDEPKFTQPTLYKLIGKHPNPREVYSKMLQERGEIDAQLAKDMDKAFRKELQERLDFVKQKPLPYICTPLEEEWLQLRRSFPEDFEKSPETAISEETVKKIGEALTKVPADFKPLKQIQRLLKDRKEQFSGEKQFNWASGELLAYGSLLLEGKDVRMTGQDVRRGTFSHRHAVLFDAETNKPYHTLNHISDEQAQMMIYNSLLSEYGVLGFEFGYSMANPNALVIWEAQFGDFANGAQVMVDQFITSTESKWQRQSGLVMLLPHGYEGQGPEHSNARPERYLQLAAEYNIIVANITTPANFFHMMRRQLAWEFRKPCIVMSPKSLLRHEECVSPLKDFTSGGFQEMIGDDYAKPLNKVKRVLVCSGKIYYELRDKQREEKRKDVAILRIEQVYPFPISQFKDTLKKYKNLEDVVWVQEEPENMGAWTYILRVFYNDADVKFRFLGRKVSASPATGYKKVHDEEQAKIIHQAFA